MNFKNFLKFVKFLFSIYDSNSSRGVRFSLQFVRLFISKPMQLGSPDLTYRCPTMSLGNPFILGSKGQGQQVKNGAGVVLASSSYHFEVQIELSIVMCVSVTGQIAFEQNDR